MRINEISRYCIIHKSILYKTHTSFSTPSWQPFQRGPHSFEKQNSFFQNTGNFHFLVESSNKGAIFNLVGGGGGCNVQYTAAPRNLNREKNGFINNLPGMNRLESEKLEGKWVLILLMEGKRNQEYRMNGKS